LYALVLLKEFEIWRVVHRLLRFN